VKERRLKHHHYRHPWDFIAWLQFQLSWNVCDLTVHRLYNMVHLCFGPSRGQLADKHHWPGRGGMPFKILCDSYSFDIAETKHDDQTALSPITVKQKGLNSKTMFVIKK
jgi:hypothetical protein